MVRLTTRLLPPCPEVPREHRELVLDGTDLPILLADATAQPSLRELVSSWNGDWYDLLDPESLAEARLVQTRSVPTLVPTVLPVLLCPDDWDFFCSVVVAEVVLADDQVIWTRLGYDLTADPAAAQVAHPIGERVEWWPDSPHFVFDRRAYHAARRSFPSPDWSSVRPTADHAR